MAASTMKYWKFQGKALLTRMGLWERVERWRLRRRFRRGFIHEPDFHFFGNFNGGAGLFADIGANLGQSALSFRAVNRTCPILSFEPNPAMEFGLREVKLILGERFDFHLCGLGAKTESRRLFVPYVRGIPFAQCATFHRDCLENDPDRRQMFHDWTGTDRFDIVEQSIQLVRFDELALCPEFVKIDVEGGELDVLTGMTATLDRCRPLLMTEGNACADFLARRDYRMFVYQVEQNHLHPAGSGDHALNYFFIPQEKIGLPRGLWNGDKVH